MTNEEADRKAARIIQQINALAGDQRRALQKVLGETAVAQAALGVRDGKDPYGRKWVKLTSRPGGRPLRRTGNNIQRSWFSKVADRNSFRFASRFRYIATHQYGAVIVPKNGPYLRFKVEGSPIMGRRAGAVRQVGAESLTVFARRVVIPRRQLVPEMDTGGLGERWLKAFERGTQRYMRTQFQGTNARVG